MTMKIEPVLGNWFKDEINQVFEVVAIDSDERTIEIQYFDGMVEELDFDVWYDKLIEPCAEPEDWSGPFDDLERDDFGDTDEIYHPTNFEEEIDHLE